MTARQHFVECVESLLGMPVLWSSKGPESYDCSGLVTACLRKVGGQDLRYTHNAQALYEATRELVFGELPLAGDLCFYGHDAKSIEHVAVYMADGGVISADGATSRITSLKASLDNPHNRVRAHTSVKYRMDTPYVAIHRNTFVDALDHVSH